MAEEKWIKAHIVLFVLANKVPGTWNGKHTKWFSKTQSKELWWSKDMAFMEARGEMKHLTGK